MFSSTKPKAHENAKAKEKKVANIPQIQKIKSPLTECYSPESSEIAPGLTRTPESASSGKKSADFTNRINPLPEVDQSRKITIRGDTFKGDEP